jgi:hypothetical protein
MKIEVPAGTTSFSQNFFIQDSSSTTGAGLGGIAPGGGPVLTGFTLDWSFTGANALRVGQALTALATVETAWTAGKCIEIDDTNLKGVLRVDLPDAMFAIGKGPGVTGLFHGGTNVAPCPFEITFSLNVLAGKVTGTSTKTSVVDSSLANYQSLTGRVIIWDYGSANYGSQAQITNHVAGAGNMTVQSLGSVPVSGDTYKVF